MIIEKKTWPEYFELILSGKKKFDLRLADFDIKEGDTLVLKEWDHKAKRYTGREVKKKVDLVTKFDMDTFDQEEEIKEKGLLIIQF